MTDLGEEMASLFGLLTRMIELEGYVVISRRSVEQ
jgi:hypothetical protein